MGSTTVVFDRFARPVRDLVRWGARWLALILAFPAAGRPPGRIEAALDWLQAVPLWAPLLLLLPALWLLRRALWAAWGEYLGADDADAAGGPADLTGQRPLRVEAWQGAGFPVVQFVLVLRALLVAALAAASGWASVQLAAGLTARHPGLAGLAAAAAVAVLLSWLEALPFLPWLPRRPPDRAQTKARLADYLAWYPQESGHASALLYAYCRLDRRALTAWIARFTPAPRAAQLAGLLLTAVLFTLAPAPSVDALASAGRAGAGYAAGVGLFTVAGPLTVVAAGALLLVGPVPVLWSFVRFGALWRMPPDAQLEVLRRERGPAWRSVRSAAWRAPVWAAAGAAALWLSATVAVRTGSAPAGLVALAAAGLLASYPAYQLTRHR